MSKAYLGFGALINGYKEFPKAGGIYTKPKINENTIDKAEYFVISSKEVIDYVKEDSVSVPLQLAGHGYHPWIEAPTVGDIISLKLEQHPDATLVDLKEAVFYYLENDTFMD